MSHLSPQIVCAEREDAEDEDFDQCERDFILY